MDDGIPTAATTSAGMPHLHGDRGVDGGLDDAYAPRSAPLKNPVQSLVDQGKAQVTSALDGVVEVVHDLAARLDDSGIGPAADYVRKAAETVAIWSRSVDGKSLEDLADDTRVFVRRNPGVAVAIAVAGGFLAARYVRSTNAPGNGQ